MDNEFGSALWDVKGIPNVGSQYIKDVKPQGFTFVTKWEEQPASPLTTLNLVLNAAAVTFTFPYLAALHSFGVAGYVFNEVTEALTIIDPKDCYLTFFATEQSAPTISWQQDPLIAYGAYPSAFVTDYQQIAFNGRQSYMPLQEYGFICRRLQVVIQAPYAITVDQRYVVVLQTRFKRV